MEDKNKNGEIFEGKTFDSLLKDIYTNSTRKEKQIQILITELKPMIKNIGDAAVIVPMIKDYLEVSVKNDDALVKLAAVVQRLVSASAKDDDGNEFGLSEDERNRLLEEAESEIKSIQKIQKEEINGDIQMDLSGSIR